LCLQAPLLWDPSLQESAQKWADYLTEAAPAHPLELASGYEATAHWPHSDQDGEYRGKGIGENIAWDFSAQGSPCDESVYRWYAEYNKLFSKFMFIYIGYKSLVQNASFEWIIIKE